MKETTRKIYEELFERYPVLNECAGVVLNAYELLFNTYMGGGKVLCGGNGGSACDCEHIIGELLKSFKKCRAVDQKTVDFGFDSQEQLFIFINGIVGLLEYNKESHIIKFLPGYRDEFLGKKFNELKELVNSNDAFEKFSSWSGIYEFQEIVNEHGGFIIADIDGVYQKLDDFIRAMDENREYVVFDSLDYHF